MPPSIEEMARYQLTQRMKSGANWFYWIAGLSLINSIAVLMGSSWAFIAGLGITQIFDAVIKQTGPIGKSIGIGMNIIVALVFIGLGYLAHRYLAGFIIGMCIYGLDSLIFLLAAEWIGLGFHVFVLFLIFGGFQASRKLAALPQPVNGPMGVSGEIQSPSPSNTSPESFNP